MDFNSRLSIGGDYIKQKSNKTKYCDRCKKEKQLEWQRESMQNIRNFNMWSFIQTSVNVRMTSVEHDF